MAGSPKQGVPSEGCQTNPLLLVHIKAIDNVCDELELWEDSDSELINGTEVFIEKVRSEHPLLLAVKELGKYYPYNRLPHEPKQNWRDFLFYTRFDPATRDSINSAVAKKGWLMEWLKNELRTLEANSYAGPNSTPLGGSIQSFGDSEDAEYDSLSDTQKNFLQTLLELKAFGSDSACTLAIIVKNAIGPEFDPDNYKRAASGLRKSGLTKAKQGPGGGNWLTEKGERFALRRKKNN